MSFDVARLPLTPAVQNPALHLWCEETREKLVFYLSSLQRQIEALQAEIDALPSGGSGGGNGVTVTVDFSTGTDLVRKTVTGQTWVTTGSEITATFTEGPGTRTVEEAVVEQLVCGVENIVDGDGFDLVVHSPNGKAYGEFNVFCVGV